MPIQGKPRMKKGGVGFKDAFRTQVCPVCGRRGIDMSHLDCPACLIPLDGVWPEAQTQLIRVYIGKDLGKQLQQDAQRLNSFGWRLVNQAYGGEAKVGLGTALMVGERASRNAKELTAIFERPRQSV